MIFQIYKCLGKEPPENFDGIYYTPFFKEYLKHACTLETIIDKNSYRLDGPDEKIKKIISNIMAIEPKNHMAIDRLFISEDGSSGSGEELVHISNDKKFPWALKDSVNPSGYLSSPWRLADDPNLFEITPVSSIAEVEELQRDYVPLNQRKSAKEERCKESKDIIKDNPDEKDLH